MTVVYFFFQRHFNSLITSAKKAGYQNIIASVQSFVVCIKWQHQFITLICDMNLQTVSVYGICHRIKINQPQNKKCYFCK